MRFCCDFRIFWVHSLSLIRDHEGVILYYWLCASNRISHLCSKNWPLFPNYSLLYPSRSRGYKLLSNRLDPVGRRILSVLCCSKEHDNIWRKSSAAFGWILSFQMQMKTHTWSQQSCSVQQLLNKCWRLCLKGVKRSIVMKGLHTVLMEGPILINSSCINKKMYSLFDKIGHFHCKGAVTGSYLLILLPQLISFW